MKKIIVSLFITTVTALAFQSCMKPADNSKTQAKIDSLTNLKTTAYRDSLKLICMNDVMAQATARADSMMKASAKKGGKPAPKKSSTTPANPKSDKMQGSSNTEEKKDKMSGSTEANTQKKKDKMKGQEPPKL